MNTTYLLGNHDGESGQVGAAHTRDGEELEEAGDVIALAHDLLLDDELGMDSVHVSGHLNLVVAQLDHGIPCVGVAVLLHVPTGRLGAEVDEEEQRNGGDKGGSEHETPVVRGVIQGQVDGGTKHDAESSPHFCVG